MFSKREWGWYLVLWQWPLFSKGPRYKLKLLYFKRGGAISMQRHKQRTEHWQRVFGSGCFIQEPYCYNHIAWHSRFFSRIEWHRYEAYKPTLVLETQRGVCREDDIERA